MPPPLHLNRRETLVFLGASAGSFIIPQSFTKAFVAQDLFDIEEISDWIRRMKRKDIIDNLKSWIGESTPPKTFLGASFLAGIYDIKPLPTGSHLHAVMMVESAFQLIEDAPKSDKWRAAIWAMDNFAEANEREVFRISQNWTLPPRPVLDIKDRPNAKNELIAALDIFDPERAERAMLGFFEAYSYEATCEQLWPYAARSFRDVGHRIIFAAQMDRTLMRIGTKFAEPALRSLVLSLATDNAGTNTEHYHYARTLIKQIPENRGAVEDSARSLKILQTLRGLGSKDAQHCILSELKVGTGSQTIWDGLRLYASELMLSRAGKKNVLPVHTVTEVEAFGYIFRRTRNDDTKYLMMFQAAAWIAMARDAISNIDGPYLTKPRIDTLPDAKVPKDILSAIESRDPAKVCARLEEFPGEDRIFMNHIRGALLQKCTQNHEFKYA
ncbi:MAG: hypothetical protein ACKVS6_05750, partial [Planctomycetota bacterium]